MPWLPSEPNTTILLRAFPTIAERAVELGLTVTSQSHLTAHGVSDQLAQLHQDVQAALASRNPTVLLRAFPTTVGGRGTPVASAAPRRNPTVLLRAFPTAMDRLTTAALLFEKSQSHLTAQGASDAVDAVAKRFEGGQPSQSHLTAQGVSDDHHHHGKSQGDGQEKVDADDLRILLQRSADLSLDAPGEIGGLTGGFSGTAKNVLWLHPLSNSF
jgi:hypothetical protein